jgi:APA family basic amino acid/polyamine antiporter
MRIQTAMAALKFLLLAGLAAYGLARLPADPASVKPLLSDPIQLGAAWGPAIMFSMFAYLGWSAAIYSAGETQNARVNVPRAMLKGTLVVMGLYLAVNVALLKHVPAEMLKAERAVLELMVRTLFGAHAASVFAAVVAFALLSGIGASAFLGPRVLQTILQGSGGHAGPLPPVPLWMIWLQGILSTVMILTGTFEQILTATGFLLGIFPMLAVLALYKRAVSEAAPVPGFARWVAGPVFLAGSGLILCLSLLERFQEMLLATGVLAVLVGVRAARNQTRKPDSQSLVK